MVDNVLYILLVEDNPGDARLICEMLKESQTIQFELTHKERLDEALSCIGSTSFDAVLLDLNLPDCQGLETALRMVAAAPHVPLIVLTGLEDEIVGMEALGKGVQDYLVKGRLGSYSLTRAILYSCQRKRFTAADGSNAFLQKERKERRLADAIYLNEIRVASLLKLHEMRGATVGQISDFVVEEQVKLTQSRVGFLGFLDQEGGILKVHSWSGSCIEECAIIDKPRQFALEKGGIWTEAVRQKAPLIMNDYAAPHAGKKGYPAGHMELKRLLVMPVLDGDRVAVVSAVGNKEHEYTESDVQQLKVLVDTMWEIIKRKLVEETLQQSEQQLKSLSSQLFIIQETERKRVAQELHDSVGQTLSALKFAVECSLNQKDKPAGKNRLKSLEALIPNIQNAIEEVDRIGKGLRPAILDDLGILATFSWFCREFQATYKHIRIEKKLAIREDEVPETLKAVIYRILQEGLNNVAKHSHADLVHISLMKKNRSIVLTIHDNGRGFDVDAELLSGSQGGGLGLVSMIRRSELSGGSLSITSQKGAGTEITSSWPYH